ncbi:BT1926 family outer membrane beta-barrel protein [Lutibacter sp.]
MKKNIILGILLALFTVVSISAQNKDSNQNCKTDSCDVVVKYAPEKGDFTAQMLFGRGAFLNSLNLSVPSSGTDPVSGAAPYVNDVSSNDNAVSNMIGAEFRYYATDRFAIKVSGGAILRNTPYVINTPGVPDTVNGGWILPPYNAVEATEEAEVNFSLGAEFLFNTKNDRLFPYVGFALPFDYARRSVFTPPYIDEAGNVILPDTGTRHVEITAFGVQAIAGVDYYIAKDLFFGFEIKPVSYTYAYSIKSPAPGLRDLAADNGTLSFFARFNFKIGFKF